MVFFAYIIKSLFVIICMWSSTQSVIDLVNALLYFSNQQPQDWHEGLEIIFNIAIIFNIQFLHKRLQAHFKYRACSRLYFQNHVGLRNKFMEAFLENFKSKALWAQMEVQEEIIHMHQCPQSNEHIQCSQCGTMHTSSINTSIIFIPSSSLSLSCSVHSFASTSRNGRMRRS